MALWKNKKMGGVFLLALLLACAAWAAYHFNREERTPFKKDRAENEGRMVNVKQLVEISCWQSHMEKQGCYSFTIKKAKQDTALLDAWMFDEYGKEIEIKGVSLPIEHFDAVCSILSEQTGKDGLREAGGEAENRAPVRDGTDRSIQAAREDGTIVSITASEELSRRLEDYFKTLTLSSCQV